MRAAVAASALLLVIASSGCAGSAEKSESTKSTSEPSSTGPTAPETFPVHGSIAVDGGYSATGSGGETCFTDGGYVDISEGVQVVIADGSGTTLALGRLGPGVLQGDGPSRTCLFRFTVEKVPAGQAFYSVAISHRGEQQYTESEIRDGLELTLGPPLR